MAADWSNFYLAAAAAAAALTALLFVAVSLRPAEIRSTPRGWDGHAAPSTRWPRS